MIKKLLILLTAAIMTCPLLPARDFEYTFEGQTITYTVIDEEAGTCMTKAYTNTDEISWITGELVLPGKPWDGEKSYKLISIGECSFRKSGVTKVMLPNTITTIGELAFSTCMSLETIKLSNSLEEIGSAAFYKCWSLKSIEFPDNIEYLPRSVCSLCERLENVKWPANIKTIGQSAFHGCASLKEIELPSGLTEIGEMAFAACGTLYSINLPATVRYIGLYAFMASARVNSIKFQAGPEELEIASQAFSDLPVKELYLGRNIKMYDESYMDGGLFDSCLKTAEKVVIENPVTSLRQYMFSGWDKLESVKLSADFKAISQGMFRRCTALKEITLPAECYIIRESAFEYSGLRKISIGSKLRYINLRAFYGCNLDSIHITTLNPPDLYTKAFDNYDAKVLVDDDGSGKVMEAYRNDNGWGSFEISPMVSPTDMVSDGPDRIEGEPGAQIQLSAKLMPENVTIPDIHWSSSNIKIATVDHTGLVTFHGVPDENNPARIRPANAEELASCKITARSLYSNAPVLEFTAFGKSVVNKIVPDNSPGGEIDYSAPYEIYTLSGTRVRSDRQSLHPGLYIIRQGSNVAKTVIR